MNESEFELYIKEVKNYVRTGTIPDSLPKGFTGNIPNSHLNNCHKIGFIGNLKQLDIQHKTLLREAIESELTNSSANSIVTSLFSLFGYKTAAQRANEFLIYLPNLDGSMTEVAHRGPSDGGVDPYVDRSGRLIT